MDKELLKMLITEIFDAVEEAEASHKWVVVILNIAEKVATSDSVLDKILSVMTTKGMNLSSLPVA